MTTLSLLALFAGSTGLLTARASGQQLQPFGPGLPVYLATLSPSGDALGNISFSWAAGVCHCQRPHIYI